MKLKGHNNTKLNDLQKPNYDNAKTKALEVLEKFGFNIPYIDPIRICREEGVDVFFANFEGRDNKISGFFYAKENVIYVNKNEYPKRQTFTIAHELGHKFLHESWLASSDYQVLFRDGVHNPSKNWREQEADFFAANLLVPKFMLDKFYKIASIEELSDLFIVSMSVIKHRINFEYGR